MPLSVKWIAAVGETLTQSSQVRERRGCGGGLEHGSTVVTVRSQFESGGPRADSESRPQAAGAHGQVGPRVLRQCGLPAAATAAAAGPVDSSSLSESETLLRSRRRPLPVAARLIRSIRVSTPGSWSRSGPLSAAARPSGHWQRSRSPGPRLTRRLNSNRVSHRTIATVTAGAAAAAVGHHDTSTVPVTRNKLDHDSKLDFHGSGPSDRDSEPEGRLHCGSGCDCLYLESCVTANVKEHPDLICLSSLLYCTVPPKCYIAVLYSMLQPVPKVYRK